MEELASWELFFSNPKWRACSGRAATAGIWELSANKAVQQGSAVAEMESFKPFSKCPGTEASCARWLILRSSKWANGGRTLFPIHHSSSEPHHVVAEQRSRTATLWPFSLRPSFLFWLSNISSLCSLALLIADSAAAGK